MPHKKITKARRSGALLSATTAAINRQELAMTTPSGKNKNVQPQRLEPSSSLADGSLLCTPLSTVVLAACDAIFDDLHTMTTGTLPIHTTATAAGEDLVNDRPQEGRMSNLSYAQRRQELALRLARHTKSVSHVTALVSSYCANYAKLEGPVGGRVQKNTAVGAGLLGDSISVANEALKHVFEAWSMADEAQDSMYFSHGSLWNSRKQCHDVCGALDLYLTGTWKDIPEDVALTIDRYEKSLEWRWRKEEVLNRLRAAVRRKLVLGEVGEAKRKGIMDSFPWENIMLEKNKGSIKLTYGGQFGGKLKGFHLRRVGEEEKYFEEHPRIYPIEARLTVMDESDDAEW